MSTDFGKRLRDARKRANLSQAELGRRAGLSQSTIAAAEDHGQRSSYVLELAAALGVDAAWLATGDGDMVNPFKVPADRDHAAHLSAREPSPATSSLLTQVRDILAPAVISWEAVMLSDLPAVFRLPVRDTALFLGLDGGPTVGDWLIFSTTRPAAPGDVVLVADAAGNAFVRRYQQRTPTHWLAVATHPGFHPLDSIADGLRVLAVQVGHLRADWDTGAAAT